MALTRTRLVAGSGFVGPSYRADRDPPPPGYGRPHRRTHQPLDCGPSGPTYCDPASLPASRRACRTDGRTAVRTYMHTYAEPAVPSGARRRIVSEQLARARGCPPFPASRRCSPHHDAAGTAPPSARRPTDAPRLNPARHCSWYVGHAHAAEAPADPDASFLHPLPYALPCLPQSLLIPPSARSCRSLETWISHGVDHPNPQRYEVHGGGGWSSPGPEPETQAATGPKARYPFTG
jgi:hypothetical protein